MSGHSKWSTIKHKKEKTDSKRGKIFTKLGREILIVAKQGGADPEVNARLKDVIAKARAMNMPNDTIARSLKKAAGEFDMSNYEDIVYEGYGPAGVAVIVEATSDNRNRTAAEVRHLFDKFGGKLGTSGCVSFMFAKKGVIVIENDGTLNVDDVVMKAIESGAEDVTSEADYIEILTTPEEFSEVRESLEKSGFKFASADVEMVPETTTKLEEQKQIDFMEKLIDNLEDLDDIQNIWHNWEE